MKGLERAVRDYLDLRRSLGFKLRWAPGALSSFVSFLKQKGADYITVPMAVQWAQQNQDSKPATVNRRLNYVRGFARYRSATDPRTQIPPWGLVRFRPRRAAPYLYRDEEVERLLEAAKQMPGLHGHTYYRLLGLLAVTGLRVNEALSLRVQDVDLERGVLTIVGAKFGKSRLVPIHSSTQEELAKYAHERDRAFRHNLTYFFVTRGGNRFQAGAVRRVFHRLSKQIGLRDLNATEGPRLHDFRHTFAVKTLVNWYRSGDRIEHSLHALSTYLGHGNVSNTYWYLSACPELLGLAVNRLEHHWEGRR